MLNHLIDFSLRHRGLVCVLALLLVFLGGQALRHLPVDAFPDTTPVQVQVNTTVPALSPLEAEQQVTLPIELALGGLPGLQNLRSVSKFGLSQVVATFDDHTSIYHARQLVSERLQSIELPAGIARPQLGPISTGLGEVFHYVVRSTDPKRSLAELREVHDWVIKPHLRQVHGVAEINSWGGFEKQFHVVAEPERLIAYHVTFAELVQALQDNNQNVGGGQIVRSGESLLVHGVGLATSTEELGDIVITAHEGVPVRVRDVARVQLDHEIRRGAVTAEGRGEAVLGLGFMLMGENSAQVTRALKAKLAEVQPSLPPDVVVETLYDRTELVDQVIGTVEHNLLFGALLVIAVLFAFLGDLRAGLIVATAIPLSMVCAGNFMLQTGIAASLLSLGAIDFGLIVDSSVIMVENCVRHLGEAGGTRSRREVVRDAAVEVRKPTMFGELIIILVFLPVLTLEGIEGKLFRPMALTMIFALAGSMVLSLTLMPVLASLCLPAKLREREPLLVRWLRRLYTPVLNRALHWRKFTLGLALLLLAGTGLLASRMGGEFVPKLGEQALAVSTVRLAGVSVDEAVELNDRLERELLARFPADIAHIWTRLGTAEIATDPMGIELSDFFLALKPRDQWQKAHTQPELVEALRQVFAEVPGMTTSFSQPIEMRMNEMIAGVRGDVAVKILGDDLGELGRLAGQVQQVLAGIPETAEATGEQLTGQPVLEVRVNPEAIARYGVSTRQVLDVVEAVGAKQVGEVRQGQRRFPLVVRLPDRQRTNPEALAATLIPTAGGAVLPLGQVATLTLTEGPATINREWGRRRVTVQANVRGTDVAGYVAEARRRIAEQVKLPEGYVLEWGGQFENMERANARLWVVVPATLGLIGILLYLTYGRAIDALRVFTGVPLAMVGGVLALWLTGQPFSVSAAIGFLALSGISVLGDMVLVSYVRQLLDQGLELGQAVSQAAQIRLRPVLMTALVACMGFVPMALSTGVGSEVQRPLATVVIGGVLSSTLLTLVVLPVLYLLLHRVSPIREPKPVALPPEQYSPS